MRECANVALALQGLRPPLRRHAPDAPHRSALLHWTTERLPVSNPGRRGRPGETGHGWAWSPSPSSCSSARKTRSGRWSGCISRRCTALVGLGGMITSRVSRGLTPAPFTPEIGGLLAFGGAMLVGIPFSFWPGGSVNDFVEIYLKVLVIVVLMIHALDRAERIDRLIVLMVAELRVRRSPVGVRLHARDSSRRRRPPDRRSRGASTATRTTSR